jgi:hypothetical protein
VLFVGAYSKILARIEQGCPSLSLQEGSCGTDAQCQAVRERMQKDATVGGLRISSPPGLPLFACSCYDRTHQPKLAHVNNTFAKNKRSREYKTEILPNYCISNSIINSMSNGNKRRMPLSLSFSFSFSFSERQSWFISCFALAGLLFCPCGSFVLPSRVFCFALAGLLLCPCGSFVSSFRFHHSGFIIQVSSFRFHHSGFIIQAGFCPFGTFFSLLFVFVLLCFLSLFCLCFVFALSGLSR